MEFCLFGVFCLGFVCLHFLFGVFVWFGFLFEFFVCFGFFEDGKGTCLKNKTCAQANRQHCSVEICSPAAHCEEIQEN